MNVGELKEVLQNIDDNIIVKVGQAFNPTLENSYEYFECKLKSGNPVGCAHQFINALSCSLDKGKNVFRIYVDY